MRLRTRQATTSLGPEFIHPNPVWPTPDTAFIYSSGMPRLYLTDKVLLLRYYRMIKGYSHLMAEYVASTLSWAVVLHCGSGMMFFGYPHTLNTK